VRRRQFITLLGGAAVWPLAARAQQPERMRRVGFLVGTYGQTDREGQDRIAVFLDTFRKLGWSDGRNVRIDYRWGGGDAVRSRPDTNYPQSTHFPFTSLAAV
jgi:putative ABC transport system substrate-binding protein